MAKTNVPPFPFQLTLETASVLSSVLGQQLVHCRNLAKEGKEAPLNEFNKLFPFFNAVATYVGQNS